MLVGETTFGKGSVQNVIPVEDGTGSAVADFPNGGVVVIFATAAFAAGLASAIRGVVPTGLELPSGPSPDMIGILTPLTRSDVIDADVALGLHEEELAGHGTA